MLRTRFPQPSPLAPEACFDELGGSIGRADGNLLVLPDPLRTVSRVHAHVAFRGGTYTVEDRGSNPLQINGKTPGRERPYPLAAGDVLGIGGYEIRVREHAPAPASAQRGAPTMPRI
ncbi:MAG TPA: FHA domain-containing protein [Rubrivivax sp.]|nr:FHA domain-containing protein [Burkholderiales bacterium]HNT39613.1 FHA domain-containing protein [Rubrivivax sp.]